MNKISEICIANIVSWRVSEAVYRNTNRIVTKCIVTPLALTLTFKVIWPFQLKKRHSMLFLYTDLVWPMGATRPKHALVNIWDHLIWPMATIAKFDEIVKIGGCIQLIKTVRVGGRAGGCQTCGTHISVTAWRIFSIRSSVELSRPVGVHCHGHRHHETYRSSDIGW